ncbi:MAG: MBL fold metallo-hydrolase, partial [Alphaproteobacteria bacterium]|nr:MBL fold metallo-hydrolase [Alphaproteobacteria bacterium]
CTLLVCTETGKAAIIDPGGDIEHVLSVAAEREAEITNIFLTHGHIDHVGGTALLAERTGAPIEGPHIEDKFWIDGIEEQGERFGFEGAAAFTPSRWLEGGDTVSFGNVTLDVVHCPGHTPGHVIFHHPGMKLAQVGDVLFQGSIGRTDLPKGDHETLLRSIRERLWPLGDDTTFIPGHGPTSTFAEERRSNPFVHD